MKRFLINAMKVAMLVPVTPALLAYAALVSIVWAGSVAGGLVDRMDNDSFLTKYIRWVREKTC